MGHRRAHVVWFFLVLASIASRIAPGIAQDNALAVILKALENEAQAAKETTEVVFTVATRPRTHSIQRVAPDRLRVRFAGGPGEDQEIVIIGPRVYQRRNGLWELTTHAFQREALPSLITFIR